MELQSHVEEITDRGAQLWVVSPDDADRLREFRDSEGLSFPILLDAEARIADSYGLLNEDNPEVPHPTAFVIDGEGVIRYMRVDKNYKIRPPAEELMAALDGLAE